MDIKSLITSECVSYGHADKVADQISDAILDAYIEEDENTRAKIETMVKDNIVIVSGWVETNSYVDVEKVIRTAMENVAYPESHNLNGNDIKIINLIDKKTEEISIGDDKVDCDLNVDQGFMVGFASNETNEFLPLGVYLAREICKGVNMLYSLGPDVKTQVCVKYGNKRPKVESITVSTMHSEEISVDEVRTLVEELIKRNRVRNEHVMDDDIHNSFIANNSKIKFHINENGARNVGGPMSDCGLTGRKIVVDQYGGYCNVGGGSFSGKDMSNLDRSAAYMCRYLAKNIVNTDIADAAKVELAYDGSKPEPCAINVELINPVNSSIGLKRCIEKYIKDNVDLTPKGIICKFFPCGIKPIFYNAARNGHFGYNDNDTYYPWEKVDFSDKLKEYIDEKELSIIEF